MSDPELMKPNLYRPDGSGACPDRPALLGGACACGHVFFPLQAYGCERCGGTDLQPRALSGAGRLLAAARVHLHTGKGREAPFTVGSIRLEDGPIIRTLIVGDGPPPRPGAAMLSLLAPVTDAEGATHLDLRFRAEA
jgi:uncharacterized OB-fold protein